MYSTAVESSVCQSAAVRLARGSQSNGLWCVVSIGMQSSLLLINTQTSSRTLNPVHLKSDMKADKTSWD